MSTIPAVANNSVQPTSARQDSPVPEPAAAPANTTNTPARVPARDNARAPFVGVPDGVSDGVSADLAGGDIGADMLAILPERRCAARRFDPAPPPSFPLRRAGFAVRVRRRALFDRAHAVALRHGAKRAGRQ